MTSKEIWKTSKKQAKVSSETECHADTLRPPHGQRNIQTSTNLTTSQTGNSGKSYKMDWETTSALTKSPTASFRSTAETIPEIEDVGNITTDLCKTKLGSHQSYSKQSSSYPVSAEKQDMIPRPTSETMMQTRTGTLSMAGFSGSKAPTQNPWTKTKSTIESKRTIKSSESDAMIQNSSFMAKTNASSSSFGPSGSKASTQIPSPMTEKQRDISTVGLSGTKATMQIPMSITKPHSGFRTNESSESDPMIQNSSFMAKAHASSSSFGPSGSKNSPQIPSTMTEKQADLSTIGRSGFNAPILNPSAQAKTHSTFGPPQSKALPCKTPEIPPRKRKVADTSELAEACKYFLTFMKAKRSDLKYQEGQLDLYTTNIQKALRDAEQVCFKLEAEPEAVAEEMSAAITQSQKLAYLLSISYRCFSKLDELGTKLQESLQTYTTDAENFHLSVDRLLEYIIGTIFEKCRQLGTL